MMTRYTSHVVNTDHHHDIHQSFFICYKTDIVGPAQTEYYHYYFSFDFRQKISMWLFLDHSV